jgi:hypothetical protein
VSEGNAHGHNATDLRLRSCTEITLFGVVSGGHLGNQIAEQNGGTARGRRSESQSRSVALDGSVRPARLLGMAMPPAVRARRRGRLPQGGIT